MPGSLEQAGRIISVVQFVQVDLLLVEEAWVQEEGAGSCAFVLPALVFFIDAGKGVCCINLLTIY